MAFSELKEINGHQALFVDGRPFLILGGQLNCDSCFSAATIDELMSAIAQCGGNTAACPLYWKIVEPEEGRFDDSILQAMLDSAEKYQLRIVLVWFGTYKNACMHYAPDWVKYDTKRFQKAIDQNGNPINDVACPTCPATLEKDICAVRHIFHYLREHDKTHRVILFQVNNEMGLMRTTRCHCTRCEKMYLEYCTKEGKTAAEETFSMDCLLEFQEGIAKAAKAIYELPCYLNVWISKHTPTEKPGIHYPAGGVTYKLTERFHERHRYIDFAAPDIYNHSYHDFHQIAEDYCFANNAFYVAEHTLSATGRAAQNTYYAIAEYLAIGFDVWAIDCAYPNLLAEPAYDLAEHRITECGYQLMAAYRPLKNTAEQIVLAQGTSRMQFWVQEEEDLTRYLDFGDIVIQIILQEGAAEKSNGLVIRMDEKEFLVAGNSCGVSFFDGDGDGVAIKRAESGWYEGDEFVKEREHIIALSLAQNTMLVREPSVTKVLLH